MDLPMMSLCFILCILTLHVNPQKAMKTVDLSSEPETFDDLYIGCQEETEDKLISDNVLKNEMENDQYFQEDWQRATDSWNSKKENLIPDLPPGFKDNHGIALVAYTGSAYSSLNAGLRSVGRSQNYYMKNFHFKAFHYYLTVALQLLSVPCDYNKQPVYRGVATIHFKPDPTSGYIKFGQFTSTSQNIQVAQNFGTASFFILTTCYGVPIEKFSYFPHEEEILVPGNELFKVSQFDESKHQFVLTSTNRKTSYFNCAYVGSTPPEPTPEIYYSGDSDMEGSADGSTL